jgi:hypothetical protein
MLMNNSIRRIVTAGMVVVLQLAAWNASATDTGTGAMSKDEAIEKAKGIFCTVAEIMFSVAMVVGVIFAILAAYKYMTAAGDSSKVSEAHKTLTYAVIGITVALLAGGVPQIVGSILQVDVSGCSG